jgi:hypothetical protein
MESNTLGQEDGPSPLGLSNGQYAKVLSADASNSKHAYTHDEIESTVSSKGPDGG